MGVKKLRFNTMNSLLSRFAEPYPYDKLISHGATLPFREYAISLVQKSSGCDENDFKLGHSMLMI